MRIGGLSSGLDTASLIQQLMNKERMPLLRMQDKQKVLNWRKDALTDFKSRLSALQQKAMNLTLSSAFNGKAVTSSDDKVVTASASGTAANTSYNVTVSSLATATSNVSTGAIGLPQATSAVLQSVLELNTGVGTDANPNAKFSDGMGITGLEQHVVAGSFKINGVTINVAADDTINLVLNKINDSRAGVTASFSGDKIILTQKTAGATPTISVSDDTSNFLTAAKLSMAVVTPGTNSGFVRKLADTGLPFTDGFFTINNYTFSVNTAADSVQSIVNKINSSGAGVTAFYDSQSDKITLTSKEVGSKSIVLGGPNDTTNFLSQLKLDQAAEQLGTDASFIVNGATITRNSNSFEYNGVTFTANSVGNATVTVKQDTDTIIASVEEFVKEYNSVMDWINGKLAEKDYRDPNLGLGIDQSTAKTELTDEQKKQGILNSDYLLKMVKNDMRRSISTPVAGVRTDMNMLSLVGISTGSYSGTVTGLSGKLVIDKDKLKAALEKDASAVQQLFTKGTASITGETFNGDGVTTVFNLENKVLSASPLPRVSIVAGAVETNLTYVRSAPAAGQFSVDFVNGKITLGAAPGGGEQVKVSYDYYDSTGSSAGVAARLKSQIDNIVRAGGLMDARTGSTGSLTREMGVIEKQIRAYEDRLLSREENLWNQFLAMEKALSSLQNQSSWLSGQLASLPGMF